LRDRSFRLANAPSRAAASSTGFAAMQEMEAKWQKKSQLADISTCEGKPCVKVDTGKIYGDEKTHI